MNWQVAAETNDVLTMPEIADPETEIRTAPPLGDGEEDWLCAWCFNRVASEKDRFCYGGKGEFAFLNPEGIRFAIITFCRTLGCRQMGVPTYAHTWFPGHAWSYCQCARCGMHLGWYYTGQHEFAGLILNRIARALHIRN